MHKLDQKVRDIREKLIDILVYFKNVEDSVVATSLSAFCWVLLDSYIAWRTQRFLLRDISLSDEINEKWYSTPSSYTFAQLNPIWRFEEELDQIFEDNCGGTLKSICEEIQKKRNISAHYKHEFNTEIRGEDVELRIKKYFIYIDVLFFVYELNAAFNVLYSDDKNEILFDLVLENEEKWSVDIVKKKFNAIISVLIHSNYNKLIVNNGLRYGRLYFAINMHNKKLVFTNDDILYKGEFNIGSDNGYFLHVLDNKGVCT